jgi:hypothetical protein
MKKYTIFTIAFIFGLFLMTGFIAKDDHDRQKRPIAVNNLPEDVREAIQEDYEGYRIQEAFIVTRSGDGAEGQREGIQRGTQREGVQQGTERTGTQREGVQQGTERTGTQREGAQQGTERTGTQREGVQQGTERTGTQREGAQQGTERTGTQREGIQQGTERTGTQREGAQQGTERTGTQREGVQQGAERTGTQREGVQQGAERTGTQREGAQQGTERTGTHREGQTGTQRGTQTERSGAERSDDEGILGGLFSSDDEDTYYEVVLAKGQETKTVKYNEDGDELDKDKDKTSSAVSDEMQHNRTPLEAANLPEPVMESIRDNYEDYRITEAFLIRDTPQHGVHHQEGAEREGVGHEGAEHTRREGAERAAMGPVADGYSYYEVKLAKEDETKTVVFTADGDEVAEDVRDRIYVIENEKKERK